MSTWVNADQVKTYQVGILRTGHRPGASSFPEKLNRTIPMGQSIYVPAFIPEP